MSDGADPVARPREPASAVLLDGGKARRLAGAHKAFLEVGDRPIALRLLEAIAPLVDDVVVATSRPEAWDALDVRCVADEIPGAGPLAGIASGLAAARRPLVVVLAADMPRVSTAVLGHLLDMAARTPGHAVAPVRSGRVEPLHAVWPANLAETARRALHAGERRPARLLERVATILVPATDLDDLDGAGETFDDIDTPEDLARG